MIGQLDINLERMFKDMLKLDTMRGADSTGILSVSMSNTPKVLKGVGTPWDLADSKRYDSFFAGYHKVLLGHNRSATRGSVSAANAHPFEFSEIIGAHNGTLRTTWELDGNRDFDVDSEVLFNHMNTNGVDDTVEKIDGAFALSWYDKVSRTLGLIRNADRPLVYTLVNGGSALVWASESWMIQIAAGYNSVKLDSSIVVLPVAELLTIDLPSYTTNNAVNVPLTVTKRNLKLKVKEEYNNYANGYRGNYEKKTLPVTTNPKVVTGNFGKEKLRANFSVTFEVVGSGKSNCNQDFIQGIIKEVNNVDKTQLITKDVRIFPEWRSGMWDLMMESCNYFHGFVKSYLDTEGGYYTVKLSSVRELQIDLDDDDSDDRVMFVGHGGTILNKEQFKRKVACGCCFCQTTDVLLDDKLIWLNDKDFICGECAEHETSEGCV